MTETSPDEPPTRRTLGNRKWVLVGTGALLLVILIFFDGCSGVEVEQEDAIAVARAALEATPERFEPDRSEIRLIRRGFPPRPAWAVVFTLADPAGDRDDFLRQAAVVVDAATGAVTEIEFIEPGES
ncbi:hypothetical protein [Candidatus Poriferisodalis sp.]|uniref:hypothetical protein n=1 Tax=Candidatus Poriferisodalis sp. TaxID=3101277 RepID=UPI003B022C8D